MRSSKLLQLLALACALLVLVLSWFSASLLVVLSLPLGVFVGWLFAVRVAIPDLRRRQAGLRQRRPRGTLLHWILPFAGSFAGLTLFDTLKRLGPAPVLRIIANFLAAASSALFTLALSAKLNPGARCAGDDRTENSV